MHHQSDSSLLWGERPLDRRTRRNGWGSFRYTRIPLSHTQVYRCQRYALTAQVHELAMNKTRTVTTNRTFSFPRRRARRGMTLYNMATMAEAHRCDVFIVILVTSTGYTITWNTDIRMPTTLRTWFQRGRGKRGGDVPLKTVTLVANTRGV